MEIQIICLAGTFIIAAILGKLIITILQKLKVGQQERLDGPQSHLKKQGTPTMGGVIMVITIIIATVILSFILDKKIRNDILILSFAAIGFGLVGFIDDYKKLVLKNTDGLSPRLKMLGQLIISVSFAIIILRVMKFNPSTYIPILKINLELPRWFYIIFVVLVMLSTTNAINLTDGVDGLATLICAIITAGLTIISYRLNSKGSSIFSSMICGTCLGFFVHNKYKAKVFMGDTGSLFLGGAIACITIYLNRPLILILVAIVPIFETLSVILQVASYKLTKKRIFKMAPLHHHFELSGWRETKVVAIFSLITLIVTAIAIFI